MLYELRCFVSVLWLRLRNNEACASTPPPQFQRTGQIGGIFGVPLSCIENMCSYFSFPPFLQWFPLSPLPVSWNGSVSALQMYFLHDPKVARLFIWNTLLHNVSPGIYWLCVGTWIHSVRKWFHYSSCQWCLVFSQDAGTAKITDLNRFAMSRSVITMSAFSSPGWR